MVYSVFDKPQNLLGAPVVAPTTSPNPAITGVSAPITDTRTLISQTAKPGYIKGFDTTQGYAPVYVPNNTYVKGISLTGKGMTTGSLTPVSGFTLPNGQQQNSNMADTLIGGVPSTIETLTKQLTPAITPTEIQQQDFLKSVASLTSDLGQKGIDQLTAEQTGGIPQLKTQYADLNSQLGVKLAESRALDASFQQANTLSEGKPITNLSIAGEKSQILRNYLAQKNSLAAEAGLLTARSQALGGQIDTAQATADRSVDLKFQTQLARLETYKAQLAAIQPLLTKQERIRAEAMAQLTNERQAKLNEEKATQKQIQNLMIDAASQGAPSNTLSVISNSKSLEQASQAYSKFIAQRKTPLVSSAGKIQPSVIPTPVIQKYGSDLEAIIGNTVATIPTKFGQQQFEEQISRARNDADKISTVASVILKGQPAEVKRDYSNQAIAIKNIDKAIALLENKIKTGVLQAGGQYVYNLVGEDFDPNLTAINQYIISAIQPYRNSITGAAWGDQEDAEYQQLFGSTKYSPAELKDRLVRVKEIMKDKSVTSLNAFVNPLNTYENPFKLDESNDVGINPNPQTPPIQKGFWTNLGSWLWGS